MRAHRLLALLALVLVASPGAAQVVVGPEKPIDLGVPVGSFVPTGKYDVAGGTNGEALLVWTQRDPQGDNATRKRQIVSRTIEAPGGALGPILRHAVKGAEPSVAVAAAGDAYLQAFAVGPESFDRALFVRSLDAAGALAGEVAEVTGELEDSHGVRSVAAARNGNAFVVAWGLRGLGVFASRIGREGIPGQQIEVEPLALPGALDVATTSDGGFVVGWTPFGVARAYSASGVPKGASIFLGGEDDDQLQALAASPAGDVIAALVFQFPGGFADPHPLVLQRFTSTGTLVDPVPLFVHELTGGGSADAAFDANGNLHVVWAELGQPVRTRTFDQNGQPMGPALDVGGMEGGTVSRVRTAALSDGTFLDVWQQGNALRAGVVSLCVPGTSVCGDGVLDPFCERCDDGPGNSDTAPDACRTTCRPAACGDAVIDAGETCDDAGTVSCDGCSATCALEVGLGCGDGVPFPICGETCDDGDADDGDGCTPLCALERAPGGGSPTSDCYTAWSIDNPTNEPRFDAPGAINDRQICLDDDPRCDFDGGLPGSCTFRLRVCVNNTDQPACQPGTRLASWELKKPSANQAAKHPELAAVRTALLGAVLPSVVGPTTRDVCSPIAEVVVPMRGTPERRRAGKLTLSTRAVLYSGANDADKLRLECRP